MEVKDTKTIWLVNKHAAPIKFNATNMRTYKLAYYFKKMGYDVYVVSSSFVHNRNIDLIDSNEPFIIKEYEGVKFVHIKSGSYNNNGLKRIFSIFYFSYKLMKYRKSLPKPDTIIHTSSIPFDFLVYKVAKKLNAKYIVEVVDLWPESFVAFGMLSQNNPFLKIMYKIEKFLYEKSDKLVFSMEGGIDYLKSKKWDKEQGGKIDLHKVYYLNNGVDIQDFDENLSKYKIEDADLENDDIKRIIYLGSIRKANNLIHFINAVELFVNDNTVKFLIYGDGDDRDFLEQYCKDKNLSNVLFKQKWIEPQYVPFVLSSSYINIMNYKPNAVEKFGGSQNKMFQALASGRPICSNIGMGYSIINKYKVGIDSRFSSNQEYANAIRSLLALPYSEYAEMCKRARNAAIDYDLKALADKYIQDII